MVLPLEEPLKIIFPVCFVSKQTHVEPYNRRFPFQKQLHVKWV